MDSERLALSTTLLLAIIGGLTYKSAGRNHGLSRTAVERRVKALALRLIREIGVEGLNESRAKFARKLREHREAIEAALACYVPVKCSRSVAEPVVLSDHDILDALRRVRQRTLTPERDVAMVWVLLATGLRPREVARLEIADYLNQDGTVRIRSQVRACVAGNSVPRPLYFSSTAARNSIDEYLATRHDQGDHSQSTFALEELSYRGLAPWAPLFLAHEESASHIDSISFAAGSRALCQEIHYAYGKIFRRIGIPGLSARNVRHTVINRLLLRGADRREIGTLLGVRELRTPARLRPGLDELMDELV